MFGRSYCFHYRYCVIILLNIINLHNNLYNTSSIFILCGDFNIDYRKDSHRQYYLESLLASFNFFSTVTFPTRIFKHSSTQIDNIYVNTYKLDFSV